MSKRQRMGKSSKERNRGSNGSTGYSSPASGWFVRGVGLAAIVMSISTAVIAICLVVLVWHLPQFFELGWSAIESADALTRAIEGMEL